MGARACWSTHSPEPSMPSRRKRCRAVLHRDRGAIEACKVVAWGWCESAGVKRIAPYGVLRRAPVLRLGVRRAPFCHATRPFIINRIRSRKRRWRSRCPRRRPRHATRPCQHAEQLADGIRQRDDQHGNGSERLHHSLTDATYRGRRDPSNSVTGQNRHARYHRDSNTAHGTVVNELKKLLGTQQCEYEVTFA